MQRVVEEAEYVLAILRRMREEAAAHPNLFEPDAQERIDKAIAIIEGVRRQAAKAA
jgi:hypothetical protein